MSVDGALEQIAHEGGPRDRSAGRKRRLHFLDPFVEGTHESARHAEVERHRVFNRRVTHGRYVPLDLVVRKRYLFGMTNLTLRTDVPTGERWTLDLDVAGLAKMAEPLNIRRTITAMANQGIINDYDDWRVRQSGGDAPPDGPFYRAEKISVPIGGTIGFKEATQFRLNDDAMVVVLGRLRTPDAERAVLGIIRGARTQMAALRAVAEARIPALLEAAREEGRQEGAQTTTLLLADPRPVFRSDCQIPRAVEAMRELLRGDRGFYANGSTLMRAIWFADGGVITRKAITVDLIIRLSELARWEKANRFDRMDPTDPPGRVVRILMADCDWAGSMPISIYETRLTRTLAEWRPGSTISIYQVLTGVTSMHRPPKHLVPWAIEECTKRGWTLDKKSKPGRDGMQQEVTLRPRP